MNRHNPLLNMFHALLDAYGPSCPVRGGSPFETAVEIILGRNASPDNAKLAMDGLRRAGLLDPARLYALGEESLAEYLRPAGHYRQKTGRLRRFLRFLRDECGFDLESLTSRHPEAARRALASINGVGLETADAILLFACGVPIFPASAAAARVALRHGLVFEDAGYEDVQECFASGLERDVRLYRECHALMARVGREYCKPKAPSCETCPLERFLK